MSNIQELIQQIKVQCREGVDFKIGCWGEEERKIVAGAIHHLSPRLKNFLRKKFGFPLGLNDHLDYSKTDPFGNNYYYLLDGEHGIKTKWSRLN